MLEEPLKDFSLENDAGFQLMVDFIKERNDRIPGLVRNLELRDNVVSLHVIDEEDGFDPVREFLLEEYAQVFYFFLEKCTGLRQVLRDGYEHESLNTIDLMKTFLKIPTLEVLCLKIHKDMEWWHHETPRFVEYEQDIHSRAIEIRDKGRARGLIGFSVSVPVNLDRLHLDEIWGLCREILVSNRTTLKHLWFDGPDFEMIVKGTPLGFLNDYKIETLRFRMNFVYQQLLWVYGLENVDLRFAHGSEPDKPFLTCVTCRRRRIRCDREIPGCMWSQSPLPQPLNPGHLSGRC